MANSKTMQARKRSESVAAALMWDAETATTVAIDGIVYRADGGLNKLLREFAREHETALIENGFRLLTDEELNLYGFAKVEIPVVEPATQTAGQE